MRIIYERALVVPLYGAAVSVAALSEHLRTDTGVCLQAGHPGVEETKTRVQLLPC